MRASDDDAFDNADDSTLSAYHASGCKTIPDFLASPACKAQTIVLANSISAVAPEVRSFLEALPQLKWGESALFFKLHTFRIDSHQQRFWDTLCFGIPSCTTFVAANTNTLSDLEIRRFCDGLASDKCMFRTLMLHGQEYGGAGMNEDNCESIHRYLWHALLLNSSVSSLSIVTRFATGYNLLTTLTDRKCPLTSLTIYITPENIRFARFLLRQVFNGLTENAIVLTSLCIHSLCTHRISLPEEFGDMLASNAFLMSLCLRNCCLPTNVFRALFSSLATNRHLQSLSLAECDGAKWPNTVVLESLQMNAVFHELDLEGTPLQDNAAISAQLARNLKNAKRAKVLLPSPKSIEARQDRADVFNMVKPTAVRIFLCGLPYSGKTTLSRSFAAHKSQAGAYRIFYRAHLERLLWARGSAPERTRGIDITTVEEGDFQVSLWDLAGQTEYYRFHDYMFPNLSSHATPALFLFVWNPIEVDEQGHHKKDQSGAFIDKSIEKLEKDLKYWLRFIASKTLRILLETLYNLTRINCLK